MASVAIDVTQLFTLFMGAGGIATVGAAVKAVQTLRKGAQTRDRDTVGGLRDQRDEAETRAAVAGRDRDYFHALLGSVIFQYQQKTGTPPDLGEHGVIPPSQRDQPTTTPAPPRRRIRRPS